MSPIFPMNFPMLFPSVFQTDPGIFVQAPIGQAAYFGQSWAGMA